jgi:hypothetical protein
VGATILNSYSNSGLVSMTRTTTATSNYLCIYLYNSGLDTGLTLQQVLDSVQIELGSQATEYTSYQGNITNFPYTLRGLPDGTKDRLVVDKKTQTAWVERKIGVKIFNGSETWFAGHKLNGFTRFYSLVSNNKFGKSNSAINVISDKFIGKSWNNAETLIDNVHTYSSDTRIGITISDTFTGCINADSDTILSSKLKTWLASNNVTVFYPLLTPTIENIIYPNIATIQYLTQISKDTIDSNMSIETIVLGN